MILEIDAGNTRVKWRAIQGGSDGKFAVLNQGVFTPDATKSGAITTLSSLLTGGRITHLERVLISNVRGMNFGALLADFFRETCGVEPEFAIPVKSLGGVESGYGDPAKLGVDRWLAILAAYEACKGPCFVLDCGTTITLDIVDAAGKHLGGYIVPGITLMRNSLAARSAALINDVPSDLNCGPGTNTAAAINNGLLAMTIGFVSEIRSRHFRSGPDAQWFISGGDGELVQKFLPWATKYVPALVLDGLRVALPGAVQRGAGV